jgi:DNA-binding transcriptional ArsR family regulator
MSTSHEVSPATAIESATGIEPATAEAVARLMAGFATASRVRILGRLRLAPCTVSELCAAVSMAQPAVSHQLRILRDLRLTVGVRDGRNMIYGLHDPHVAVLLDEALRHVEQLRTGASALTPPSDCAAAEQRTG